MTQGIEFITNVAVQLCANKSVFGRKHIMIVRVTGASGIEKM